jgi:hypothetical protein
VLNNNDNKQKTTLKEMQRFLIDMDNPDKKTATINTCIRVNKAKLGDESRFSRWAGFSCSYRTGAVVVVIVWLLDLQLTCAISAYHH